MNKVLLQFWEESECGCVVRPDGASLHLDINSYNKYLNKIYNKRVNVIPNEYNRIIGSIIEVKVNDNIYNMISSKCNLRLAQYELNNLIKLKEIMI